MTNAARRRHGDTWINEHDEVIPKPNLEGGANVTIGYTTAEEEQP